MITENYSQLNMHSYCFCLSYEQLPNPLKPQMSLFCAIKTYFNHHKYLFPFHTFRFFSYAILHWPQRGGMSKNLRKCSWNAFGFSVNGFKQTSGLACLSMVSAWWEKRQYCQGFKCGLSELWKDVSSVECSQLLECFLWAQWFLECVPFEVKENKERCFHLSSCVLCFCPFDITN